MQVPEPEFEGQTKTRLGNPEVRKIVEGIVSQVPTCLDSTLACSFMCKDCVWPMQSMSAAIA